MIVYLVRHALAADRGDPQYPDDASRPLVKRGRKRFSRIARELTARGMAPHLVATSPLVRCRQTAGLLLEQLAGDASLVELDELKPGAQLADLIAWTRRQGKQDVAWVGHAPDVEEMAAGLIGSGSGAIRLAKGAVAAIDCGEEILAGAGRLRWLVTAKVLGC